MEDDDKTLGRIMAALVGLMIIALLLAMSGCCPCRHIQTDTRDSVRVETHTVTVERIDTQLVEIPVEVYRNVTLDTSSTLRGKYAESSAVVTGGVLLHTLTANGKIPVKVKVVDRWRDSIQYRDRVEIKVVEVAKPLNGWQRFQRTGFWILLTLLAGMVIFSVARWYLRKF